MWNISTLTDKQNEAINYNWRNRDFVDFWKKDNFAYITFKDGEKVIQNLNIKTDWLLRLPNGNPSRIKNKAFDTLWEDRGE